MMNRSNAVNIFKYMSTADKTTKNSLFILYKAIFNLSAALQCFATIRSLSCVVFLQFNFPPSNTFVATTEKFNKYFSQQIKKLCGKAQVE